MASLKDIEYLVLDCDGVLTDNTVWIAPGGEELVRFSKADGHGIMLAKQAGIKVVVLTTSVSHASRARMMRLDVPMYVLVDGNLFIWKYNPPDYNRPNAEWELSPSWADVPDKGVALSVMYYETEKICFVGNDVPDLAAMRVSGFVMCPADAHPQVIKYVLQRRKDIGDALMLDTIGGHGAVREAIDRILEKK